MSPWVESAGDDLGRVHHGQPVAGRAQTIESLIRSAVEGNPRRRVRAGVVVEAGDRSSLFFDNLLEPLAR